MVLCLRNCNEGIKCTLGSEGVYRAVDNEKSEKDTMRKVVFSWTI